ncbi:MAG: insulinase family protein [Chloroflexota bacterium]|nr:insulinase family protein [Chloroflexota bacterium]MDE2942553.1 insulinase family protein [Chloroflexota bacterium]MDE3268554.1 insulinase family protein [Chloroflexota bacterium]
MSTRFRYVVVTVVLALLAVALAACESEPTPAPTQAPTATPAPTATATLEPTAAPEPTATSIPPTATSVPTPTAEPTVAPTATPTPPPTATLAPTPTPEPTATATPTPEPDLPLAFDPLVVRGTLSNGIRYYIRHNEEPRDRAQISLVVKAGSVHEEEHQRGLAHYVEHMAFNGTERFAKQEIIDYLESIGSDFGADVNASTGFDRTAYFLEIPTDDPEITETAFEILSDWAYAVTFDPEEVELERGVVLEEWRLSQGFYSRLQDNLFQLIFGSSIYARRAPIGLPEVIESADADLLREYYDRWYRPGLMAVIAVGDFDVKAMEAKVKEHFAPPPEGEASQESAVPGIATSRPVVRIPGHAEPRIEVFTDSESPGTQFVLIRKLAPEKGQTKAAFRRSVVERLAFMMLNARLFERAQEADAPYLVADGGRSPYAEPLDIVTFSAWVESGGIEVGLQAVLEELQRVRLHGFTESELTREKSNLMSQAESYYRQREQVPTQSFVNEYTDHFLNGTLVPGIKAEWALYQELLAEIALEEFADVTEPWTMSEDTSLLIVRPAATEAGTDEALASATLSQLMAAGTLDVEPYADELGDVPLMPTLPTPGSIISEEQIGSIDAQRWTLSNGVTVIAKQTDFRDDEVEFTAFSPGGHSLVSDEDHTSALFAAALATGSGVGVHDRVALDKLLAGKRVSVSPYIAELFEGFSGSASPDDMETMFQLIALYSTMPRFDPVVFDQFEARLRSIAEFYAAEPDVVLFDTVRSVLSQNHLRERPLSVELIEELSLQRAAAVYADRFADMSDATFVFVGAFEWETMRSLAETYLASLPTTGRAEEWRDTGIDPPPGIEEHVVHKGVEPRSNSVLVYAGDMEWSRGEALRLNVAGEMLGTRLRERIREALSGTYAISVNSGSRSLPDPEYQISIIFGSDPSRTEELFGEVLTEVAWLREGGEQEYLDKAKELLRTSREEQLRMNGFWLSQIRAAAQRGEPFEAIVGFDELLDAVTLDDIAAVARRYFGEDRYIRVVLKPEEG